VPHLDLSVLCNDCAQGLVVAGVAIREFIFARHFEEHESRNFRSDPHHHPISGLRAIAAIESNRCYYLLELTLRLMSYVSQRKGPCRPCR
jgi:hypothetical protein